MRTERTYSYVARANGEYDIEETVMEYCEIKSCEVTHEDPSIKWDSRTYRTLARVYSLADAIRLLAALQRYA